MNGFVTNRRNVFFAIFALLFSVINTHIFFLQYLEGLSGALILELICIPVVGVLVFFIACRLHTFLSKWKIQDEKLPRDSQSCRRYFFVVCAIQLLAWGVILLAYWPGLLNYDISVQLKQGHGEVINTHHPLVHNLYMWFFYYDIGEKLLKNYNAGIFLSVLVQMILVSGMVSYRYALIGFTSLLPTVSMIVISTTKDGFFFGFVALFFTLLCDFELDRVAFSGNIKKIILMFFATVGLILFRKNGVYAIIAVAVISLFQMIYRKEAKECGKTVLTLFIGLLAGIAMLSGLKAALGAKSGSLKEMLCVPYQQIAYVYSLHEQEIGDEDKSIIEEIIPTIENYEYYRADPVKDYAVIENKKSLLLKLWINLGKKYWKDYITAFLRLDAGYLSLTDISYSEIYGAANRKGVLLSFWVSDFGVEHRALLPHVEWLYEKLYTENYFKYVPVLNVLMSPAFYLWLILLLFAFSLTDKKYYTVPLFIFLMTYVATLMLGPCVLVRYALPYIICVPAYGFCVLGTKEEGVSKR